METVAYAIWTALNSIYFITIYLYFEIDMTAIRLTFSVTDGKPRLLQKQRVTMRVPPARHLSAIGREAGNWLETRDQNRVRLREHY